MNTLSHMLEGYSRYKPQNGSWIGILGRVWYFIASIPDLCTLTYFKYIWPDALAVVRPSGVYLLDFVCSGIQFYLLLSPYICFISLLYLDLYVLGDDTLIS